MKKIILALAILCLSTPAFALDPTGTGYVNGKPKFNVIGLRIDAGAPDGLGFSLAGRPLKFFQVELGGTTTLVGGGIRGGATLFLPWYVSPSITIEGGHQWGGDFNKLAVMFGASDPKISLLRDIQYDYANFHGGLGFGHPNWFMFSIHAGYSYITGNTRGLEAFVREKSGESTLTAKEANVKVWTPSAKVVFQIYF